MEVVWRKEPCSFWVESELGAGTFAKVFGVKHSMTHTQYALKVARSMGMDAAVAEYQVYTQLMGHPHILQCFGPVTVSMDDFPRFGLCLELGSDDLVQYLTRPENLLVNGAGVPERWCFLFQILTGLRFIHEQSILHADLKPNNILVCQDRLLKISDFGNSIRLNESGCRKVHADSVYCFAYRSWELLEKQDHQCVSDMFLFVQRSMYQCHRFFL